MFWMDDASVIRRQLQGVRTERSVTAPYNAALSRDWLGLARCNRAPPITIHPT